MSAISDVRAEQATRTLALVAVLAAAAVTLAGIAMATGLLGTDGLTRSGPLGGRTTSSSTHQIGEDVRTSFGIVAVEYVKSIEGLSSRSLAGATHGTPGLIDPQHVQVQAALAVTNRITTPLFFTVDLVRLRVSFGGHTTVLKPVSGDIPDTRVLANAGIEGHLDFVVPRNGARLTLQVNDPGSKNPVLIDLGKTDFAPAGSAGEHGH